MMFAAAFPAAALSHFNPLPSSQPGNQAASCLHPLLYYPPFSLIALAALLSTIAFLCHFTLVSTLIKARKAHKALESRNAGYIDSNWEITLEQ